MKENEKPDFFDTFEEYKQKRENNKQVNYENKVCKKLITRMFEAGSSEREYWSKRLEASSEPLADLQELVDPFCLTTHRLQQWSINDLLGPPTKIYRLPLWEKFAIKVSECSPQQIPAMVFYNSVIGQDMVIHTGLNTQMPKGYFRLIRASTSGEGGAIIDTLDGFLELIVGN
jgi:hypothetical protein